MWQEAGGNAGRWWQCREVAVLPSSQQVPPALYAWCHSDVPHGSPRRGKNFGDSFTLVASQRAGSREGLPSP